MKIGEKKTWKTKRGQMTLERIKFDWKAFLGWIIFIGIIVWLIWFK